VQGCFDQFWLDPVLGEQFADAWAAVAEAVCPLPRVVGFDLFNEPYPGSNLFEPDWDNDVLLPFYERIMARIEAVCPGRLFFLEPSAGYVLGVALPLEIPTALRDRVVFAGHFYPQSVHAPNGGGYDGDATALADTVSRTFGPFLEAGIPVWNGEWGGITTNPGFADYVRDYQEILMRQNVSSALWDYIRSDGGFAFLDAAGQPKSVFTATFATPALTRLPAAPEVTPQLAAGTVTARFECVAGRQVTVLLPATGCRCDAAPADALDGALQGPGFASATCLAPDAVTLTCTCPR
jgi:aryl-phospho-beta-D-glucosidase BglC (GH1 family)